MSEHFRDIFIRTQFQPGDMGYVIYLHGSLYSQEYGYSLAFENYVAKGLSEFISAYKSDRDAVWICEHNAQIVGFLSLVDRGNNSAQLRYFVLNPAYRGLGLGKKLMDEFMKCVRERGYKHAFLWTTNEQKEAAALYRKYGFRQTEERESTTFGKAVTELRYDQEFEL